MSRMAAVKKQNPQTWANLHSRLRSTHFSYKEIFPVRVGEYLSNNAASKGCCDGYLVDAVLATASFLLGQKSWISYDGIRSKTNLYIVIVGPPSTGKSQAIVTGTLDPLEVIRENREESSSYVIDKVTSAGLLYRLASHDGILASTELFDILNQMSKLDSNTSNGNIGMLCQLFSGEKVTSTYAIQPGKEIKADRAFCIIGALQPSTAAQLFTTLDVGNGFIERVLLHFPDCLVPSVESTKRARAELEGKPSLSDVLQMVGRLTEKGGEYVFDDESTQELHSLRQSYIDAINGSIIECSSPPQTKQLDLIMRLSLAIHVLSSVITQFLDAAEHTPPSRVISRQSLDAANKFVKYSESQKETFFHELRDITTHANTPTIKQPSQDEVTTAVIKSSGPLLTYRSFKNSCSKKFRGVSHAEYERALQDLHKLGKSVKVVMPSNNKRIKVFVKKAPTDVKWEDTFPVTREEYTASYGKRLPSVITPAMKHVFIEDGLCSRETLF